MAISLPVKEANHILVNQLLYHCTNNELSMMKDILDNYKLDINSVNYNKRSCLHIACMNGHLNIVKFLVENNIDVNLVDYEGKYALDYALKNKYFEIIKYLRANNAKEHVQPKDLTPFYKNKFMLTYLLFEITVIGLYTMFTEFSTEQSAPNTYSTFSDIHVMTVLGFGFTMAFIRKYGYSATSYSLLMTSIALQWYPLLRQFWSNVFHQATTHITLDYKNFIFADFSTISLLVTYGALVGKTSSFQMLVISIVQPIIYSLNERLGIFLEVTDVGGSILVHTFGAVFGLALSALMTPREAFETVDNEPVYQSDIISMIGTLFLWIYWPSYNMIMATESEQMRVVMATVLSLSASVIAAFVASNFLRGQNKFDMRDIQNASIAGGVAIGVCAHMITNPGYAIGVGGSAGFMTVVSSVAIKPLLEEVFGLHDTMNVMGTHGISGIMGATYGAIASYRYYGFTLYQSSMIIAFLGITVGIALVAGLLLGLGLRYARKSKRVFIDDEYWFTADIKMPRARQYIEAEEMEEARALVNTESIQPVAQVAVEMA